MIVLGIETSCDETSAAVVKDGRKILSNIVSSQEAIHKKYGGVVPELASRKHVEMILPVIREALSHASLTLDDINGIAVTHGPGLIGSLLAGLSVAKAIAYTKNIPFCVVSHLESHLVSIFLEHGDIDFPYVGLLVSGGHSSLYCVRGFEQFECIGRTRDDAAGEAFDKVAKLLNLGYPGGPIIDALAKEGNNNSLRFPRGMLSDDNFDFSFSGLKTSVVQYVKGLNQSEIPIKVKDIAASFQEAVIDVLIRKTIKAAKKLEIKRVVIAGGVASNSRLREKLKSEAQKSDCQLFTPSPVLCTDNAAMTACLGTYYLNKGCYASYDVNAFAYV